MKGLHKQREIAREGEGRRGTGGGAGGNTHVYTQDSIFWAKLKFQNKNSPAFYSP